ncbi:MAG: hypothetical protein IJH84_21330 [Saccharopolyspora sp.]|uniref:hypothetical protein n=1 Tax=Saccharopolyspora TaxID=1835 RepID=UPI00190A9EB4|nr:MULTISPECIES: hypothetical protein [unclassified Saccharopolyspora]MBK0865847.1 hypothetical protein [Saccharopolyspora sp. HNM0986]MBQ6643558.1 hypothetical protein [Saccharopolyspora sp.]
MADDDSRANGDDHTKPDTVLLVAGALALLLAGSLLLGGTEDFWMEWSLAGIAVFVGLILLVVSMRRR